MVNDGLIIKTDNEPIIAVDEGRGDDTSYLMFDMDGDKATATYCGRRTAIYSGPFEVDVWSVSFKGKAREVSIDAAVGKVFGFVSAEYRSRLESSWKLAASLDEVLPPSDEPEAKLPAPVSIFDGAGRAIGKKVTDEFHVWTVFRGVVDSSGVMVKVNQDIRDLYIPKEAMADLGEGSADYLRLLELVWHQAAPTP